MLKMILKDLRLSPLRSILTSVSMLVGIIAMLGSVLVGTLGREYLISVNAQVYGWSPTYSFVITKSDFHDRNKMEQLFQRFEAIDDVAAVTFSMGEDIRFAPMKDLTPIPPNDVYQNLMAFDLVCTTEAYSQVYNLPMTSGRWLEPSSEGGSLEVVINKEAKNYFNDSPYAAGNVKSTLSLTPFNIVGVVNDGRDFPTIYADSAAILNFAPAMWQVQNANVYWHPTTGLTIEQIHSALGDILTDTIGGYWESAGRSDIGDTYDSVLSILQLGLLVTSLLLLFVSVLGQINIGLSSLEQRTHELLIRRAIGASRTNIVALVLGSQLILSIFVCFAAILISLILVHCIGALLPVDSPVGTPSYPISVAVVAVAVSVLTALIMEFKAQDSTAFDDMLAFVKQHPDFEKLEISYEPTLSLSSLEINLSRRRVINNGQEIELTVKEYDILCLLAANKGRVLTYEQIYDKVWGEISAGNEKDTVGFHIRNLRKKLCDTNSHFSIDSVREIGYRFNSQ